MKTYRFYGLPAFGDSPDFLGKFALSNPHQKICNILDAKTDWIFLTEEEIINKSQYRMFWYTLWEADQ